MKETGHNTRVWRMQDAIQEYKVNKTQFMSMKEVRHNTWVWRKQGTIHEHEGSRTQYMSMKEARRNTVQFTVVWRQQDEIHKLSIVWRKQDRIQEYEGISLEEAAECILYSIFSLLRTDFGSFFFFPKLMLL